MAVGLTIGQSFRSRFDSLAAWRDVRFRRMSEFQPLIDELQREEVRAARAMTPEQRFELALRISEDNLAAAAGPELERRLGRLRAWNDALCYGPPLARPAG